MSKVIKLKIGDKYHHISQHKPFTVTHEDSHGYYLTIMDGSCSRVEYVSKSALGMTEFNKIWFSNKTDMLTQRISNSQRCLDVDREMLLRHHVRHHNVGHELTALLAILPDSLINDSFMQEEIRLFAGDELNRDDGTDYLIHMVESLSEYTNITSDIHRAIAGVWVITNPDNKWISSISSKAYETQYEAWVHVMIHFIDFIESNPF